MFKERFNKNITLRTSTINDIKGVDKKMKKRILNIMDKSIVRKAKRMVDKSRSKSPVN